MSSIASISTQTAPIRNYSAASAQVKHRDNDGDYDNGTGQDDVAKKQALQNAAQPYLGSSIDIKA